MPKLKTAPAAHDRDPLWYKKAIIYQAHVRSFCDSDADGIGDFRGVASKLDYLQDLGVTALWLLPFYPSPLRDDGYDIADYYSINPSYGTLADFKAFLKEAHRRGVRVITELVINHTSDQHSWFQKSRRAKPGSRWRDFYVWSDTPDRYKEARIIFKDFEPSNWSWDPVADAYFWHRFYAHQPDLNFDHPEVHKELFKVLDFWLELGVDGLRLSIGIGTVSRYLKNQTVLGFGNRENDENPDKCSTVFHAHAPPVEHLSESLPRSEVSSETR